MDDELTTLAAAAEEHGAFLTAETERIREALEREQAHRARLTEWVDACAQRERRLRRALDALTATTAPAPGRPRGTAKRSTNQWTVSEPVLETVWAAIRDQGPDARFTVPEIAPRAGHSREAVRRALMALREREQVRVTKPGGRGVTTVFALMPGATENGA